jgi:hypothetical protein
MLSDPVRGTNSGERAFLLATKPRAWSITHLVGRDSARVLNKVQANHREFFVEREAQTSLRTAVTFLSAYDLLSRAAFQFSAVQSGDFQVEKEYSRARAACVAVTPDAFCGINVLPGGCYYAPSSFTS